MVLNILNKQEAIKLICSLESFKSSAYPDSAGIPTIGYGTTVYPTGIKVTLKDQCVSKNQAQFYLECHLEKHVYPLIEQYDVPDVVYVALASFVYNEGHVRDAVDAVLKVQPLDLDALATAFRKYVFSNGKVCPGLVNRRKTEIQYFRENK
ncbi:MAG TPA: lysozyme [Candidatus Sulfopaludibacter sp.]|nr:lysozyme [Candidatus Sulfopaludibacter sp.]